jgi:hypothetical protein
MGAGSWQCWQGSQLNTSNYGNPFWNGNSGDGNQSGIGWLMTGTGGQNSLSVSPPGALGYFGSAGGGGAGNSLYFAGTGASVTVSRLAQLTSNAGVESVGWYSIDPNNPNTAPTAATMHALVSYSVAATTFQPTAYYGLYLNGPSGTVYFTQPQFNQVNADGLQHFAVFQQSASSYYIGVEDTGKTESDLDYNDMVIQLTVGGNTAPAVTLSPTSLTFGNQTVPTTSASQSVTVTNSGTAALTISSLAITGSNAADFSKTTTCGSSVAVGGNCTVTVAFTPAAVGSRSASLTLTDNAAGSPHAVALSGTGVVATGGATATYVGADTATQGTWTGKYGADGQLIPNVLTSAPSYASVIVTGANAYTWASGTSDPRALQTASGSTQRVPSTYYSFNAVNIDMNLTDGNTHKISLYLCDWDNGGRAETISVIDVSSGAVLDTRPFSSFYGGVYAVWNIKGHVQIKVAYTGGSNAVVNGIFFDTAGGGGGAPVDTLSPTSLAFGNQTVAAAGASQSVTVSNTGTAALTIGSVAITGTNSGDFSKTTTCGSSVAVGGNCTVTVAFTPAAAGSRSASLAITDNAAGSPHTVALSGTGVPATGGPTASYVGSDTTTQGTWTGKYGADGQLIPNVLTNAPSYAGVNVTAANAYTWASGTLDPRALQTASGSTQRVPSTYYSFNAVNIDMNLTDGNTHKISLYLCDWDNGGRAETISVIDVSSGAVLDTRPFASFYGGVYAAWNIKGHVQIKVAYTGGSNAVVNGIFFDPAGSGGSAPAVTLSPTSLVFGNQTVPTASASQTVTLSNTGTGALTISSLAIAGSNSGDFSKTTTCGSSVAAGGNCTVTVIFAPAVQGSRSAGLTITDNAAGSPHTVALSGTGVAATGGATASYLGSDTTTLGNWTGKYGADGQVIPNDLTNVPSYASVNVTGANAYTWASGTSDPRALQYASGSLTRIPSTYYSFDAVNIDMNLTDGNTHKISLYLCDWDNGGRAETISVIDVSSGAVLDTRPFSSFYGGVYAVWNIKGHVQIKVAYTGGYNAVVNGIFFDPAS